MTSKSFVGVGGSGRSGEHTHEPQSHRDLHSFPTRRSSDLKRVDAAKSPEPNRLASQVGAVSDDIQILRRRRWLRAIGRAHARTPVTPRSTLFSYTTLFRSEARGRSEVPRAESACLPGRRCSR